MNGQIYNHSSRIFPNPCLTAGCFYCASNCDSGELPPFQYGYSSLYSPYRKNFRYRGKCALSICSWGFSTFYCPQDISKTGIPHLHSVRYNQYCLMLLLARQCFAWTIKFFVLFSFLAFVCSSVSLAIGNPPSFGICRFYIGIENMKYGVSFCKKKALKLSYMHGKRIYETGLFICPIIYINFSTGQKIGGAGEGFSRAAFENEGHFCGYSEKMVIVISKKMYIAPIIFKMGYFHPTVKCLLASFQTVILRTSNSRSIP